MINAFPMIFPPISFLPSTFGYYIYNVTIFLSFSCFHAFVCLLLFAQRQEHLPDDLAGHGSRSSALIVMRAQLIYVAGRYIALLADQSGCFAKLLKGDPARFWRTCSRKYGRIQHIQIQSKVNRNILQLFQDFLKALKIKFSGFYMVFSPVKFFPVSRADTKLIDTSVSCHLPASSQHTGVGKFCSQIVLAQICMGVKMNHMDVRKFFNRCPESPQ